jgi:hypothetical protein
MSELVGLVESVFQEGIEMKITVKLYIYEF